MPYDCQLGHWLKNKRWPDSLLSETPARRIYWMWLSHRYSPNKVVVFHLFKRPSNDGSRTTLGTAKWLSNTLTEMARTYSLKTLCHDGTKRLGGACLWTIRTMCFSRSWFEAAEKTRKNWINHAGSIIRLSGWSSCQRNNPLCKHRQTSEMKLGYGHTLTSSLLWHKQPLLLWFKRNWDQEAGDELIWFVPVLTDGWAKLCLTARNIGDPIDGAKHRKEGIGQSC